MLRDIEQVAEAAGLLLSARASTWTCAVDWPHIATFAYDLAVVDDGDEPDEPDEPERRAVGMVDGYRITHDWTVESALALWDEADALDGDVVHYVEALIRELRACEQVFDSAPDLADAQRITIVRHVEALAGVDSASLTQGAVASLAMMDAPVLMLVDPWPMADERRAPVGKLTGRKHAPKLLDLGFVRMVGSRFLWAWNRYLSEGLMEGYSYDGLVAAKRSGALAPLLESPLANEVYGELPRDVAKNMGVPDPDDLMDE
jgi:hypothetical protein